MSLFSTVLALAAFIAMADASPAKSDKKVYYDLNEADKLFEQFIKDYERTYESPDDKEVHFKAFVKSLETINRLNKESSSATYGLNKFADHTEEEKKKMFGFRPN